MANLPKPIKVAHITTVDMSLYGLLLNQLVTIQQSGYEVVGISTDGEYVPPQDPQALAEAWKTLIEMGTEERTMLGKKARQRIIEHYSLPMITKQYEALYREISR
jgi:glycosyltransferase involved in cell wall biosynthesis